MKRQRSNAALAGGEEEDESSGFYLKHQNKALASELKGLQYQLRLLEKERDLRRQQCHDAGEALQALENTWTQMEVALQLGTPPDGSAVSALHQSSKMQDTFFMRLIIFMPCRFVVWRDAACCVRRCKSIC